MAEVQVQAHAVLHVRRASSECHGAKLDLAPEGADHPFACRECAQPCEVTYGEPEEVHAHG